MKSPITMSRMCFYRTGGLLCLLIGFASPYWFTKIGLHIGDEAYQILLAQDYTVAPLSFLSAWLGGLWGKTFGWDLLSMRYYTVTIQLAALSACCWYMYRRTKKATLCMMISGIVALLMSSLNTFTMVGWDATSNTFVLLGALCALVYIQQPRVTANLLLAFISACAIASRLPNVTIVPAIVIVICLATYKSGNFRTVLSQIAIYIVSTLVIFATFVVIAFGSFDAYQIAIAENTVSAHNISAIFMPWLGPVQLILPKVLGISIVFFVLYLINKKFRNNKYAWLAGVAILIVYGCVRILRLSQVDYLTCYFYICAYYALLLILFGRKLKLGVLFVLASFQFIPAFGSNIPLWKIYAPAMLPLLFAYTLPLFNKPLKVFSWTLAPILILSLFVCYGEVPGVPGAHKHADSYINVPKLHGIRTYASQAKVMENLWAEIQHYHGYRLIFLSPRADRYMGYYLDGHAPKYDLHNWDSELLDNPQHISATIRTIKESASPSAIFVFSSSDVSDTRMHHELSKLNFSSFKTLEAFTLYTQD